MTTLAARLCDIRCYVLCVQRNNKSNLPEQSEWELNPASVNTTSRLSSSKSHELECNPFISDTPALAVALFSFLYPAVDDEDGWEARSW